MTKLDYWRLVVEGCVIGALLCQVMINRRISEIVKLLHKRIEALEQRN